MSSSDFQTHIKSLIALHGPIPLDQFMNMAVQHYYAIRQPFGQYGDFITAPEISQMFGEILGVWLADKWLHFGSPSFSLVELGGGNGTMMADILRSTQHIPGLHAALSSIAMIEQSGTLMHKQQAALKKHLDKTKWYNSLHTAMGALTSEDITRESAFFVLNNEFFDALPVKQYTRDNHGIREVCIGIQGDELVFAYSSPLPLSSDMLPGQTIEASPARSNYAHDIAVLCKHYQQYAGLIIDYGYLTSPYCSTLQAIIKHKHVDVLRTAGEADLTALVDFSALMTVMKQHNVAHKCWSQGMFLEHYGIHLRAEQLIKNGADQEVMARQLERLISPSGMGSLFKVLEFGM